jgi:hypothetical protein
MPVEVRAAIPPPDRAAFTERYFGVVYIFPSLLHLRRIARRLGLFDLTPSGHERIDQTLTHILFKRRI